MGEIDDSVKNDNDLDPIEPMSSRQFDAEDVNMGGEGIPTPIINVPMTPAAGDQYTRLDDENYEKSSQHFHNTHEDLRDKMPSRTEKLTPANS